MLHKTLDAKATVTELGEFTAIAAAYTVDRGNERILPGAFAKTIQRWQESGKRVPVHWDHGGAAADIIGTVDPVSMEETELGLKVAGQLDLDNSDVAKEAWRAMKSNALSLSFGYMVINGGEAEDGVYELREVDLFEISVTPAPMNPDTRFLNLKSVDSIPLRDHLIAEGIKRYGEDSWVILDAMDEDEKWAVYFLPEAKRYLKVAYTEDGLAEEEVEVTKTYPPVNATSTAVEDGGDEEPEKAKSAPQDSLKQDSLSVALEVLSDGASLRKYEKPAQVPGPEPSTEDEQRRHFCELVI